MRRWGMMGLLLPTTSARRLQRSRSWLAAQLDRWPASDIRTFQYLVIVVLRYRCFQTPFSLLGIPVEQNISFLSTR